MADTRIDDAFLRFQAVLAGREGRGRGTAPQRRGVAAAMRAATLVCLLVVSTPLREIMAQDPRLDPRPVMPTGWLSLSLGIGTEGTAVGGALSVQHRHHLFGLRATAMGDLFGEAFGDLGLLYGRIRGDDYRLSLAAGPAVMVAQRCTGIFSCDPSENAIGLALAAELFAVFADVLGFGVSWFANINAVQTFAGLALSLHLGKFR